ncbi:MAG: tail fiber domain-containing protein [Saprospiraceae bacterium]
MKNRFIHLLLICTFSLYHLISFSQKIGIGTLFPAGKLHIKGAENISQLIIDANAIQGNTNPLIKLRDSSGTDLMWIHTDHPSNTFIGLHAGSLNDAGLGGTYNTFIGKEAGAFNTIGHDNAANGTYTLYSNTEGYENTANGPSALYFNTIGYKNTAMGSGALSANVSACLNTAIGTYALLSQSYDPGYPWISGNVAVGYHALGNNQPTSTDNGVSNTAIGFNALQTNTIGYSNSAIGLNALSSNSTGIWNTAEGVSALYSATIGNLNTGIGVNALINIVGGSENTSLGVNSGTAPGSPNISNTVSIGNNGYLNAATNQAFIGNLSTSWIGGQTNWFTYASDARVKNDVQADVSGLAFISRLKPVTYHLNIQAMREITGNEDTQDYPEKYDIEKIKQSGFLAQEVEQAAKQSGYDFSGITIPKNARELYTMSYAQFVVPLVKAVQEQQTIIEDQQSQIDRLVKRIEALEKK